MPTVQGFLDDRFIPDAETTHKGKVKAIQYYRQGAAMLKRSKLTGLRLDELTGEHVGWFAAEYKRLSPSGINMGLRTMRRALNLAYPWGVIEKPVKVELAKGENQRDRVLITDELTVYLQNCPQPWQDAATIIADEGMRPGEVFVMRWEYVLLGEEESGLIRVVQGKSKAARRVLPITPRVHRLLNARHQDQNYPSEGWVFPSQSKHGHLEVQTAKRQHATALENSGVVPFVPYVLRHTALTRLGKAARGDVFALAKIAGHSSITITQKYVHPEEETIDEVFSRLNVGNTVGSQKKEVPTKGPTVKKKAAKRLAAGIAKELNCRRMSGADERS
jgi:integrase